MKLASFLLLTVYAATASGLSTFPYDIGFNLYPNPSTSADTDALGYWDNQALLKSRFDPTKPLIMYTGGFTQDCSAGLPIINAYLAKGFSDNFNIICVEWGPLAGKDDSIASLLAYNFSVPMTAANWATFGQYPLYQNVTQNVPVVASHITDFLLFLDINGWLPVNSFVNSHLIGFDIGAHIMGIVGKLLQEQSILLGRITGLDPAAQGFQNVDPSSRLFESDAGYVDVLFTNPGGAGYWGNDVGDARTYINGNSYLFIQPPCRVGNNALSPCCSHLLSIYYFAKSITDTSLTVKNCNINEPASQTTCQTTPYAIPFGEYMKSALGNFYINNLSPN